MRATLFIAAVAAAVGGAGTIVGASPSGPAQASPAAAAFGGSIGNYVQCARALTANSPSACCTNTWIDARNQTDVGQQSGLILSTQFWDGGASGQADLVRSTSIHGLWPDHCDGSYPQYCTAQTGIPERTAAQIVQIISQNDPALFAYMQKYYLGTPDAPSFWEHEYNKHGTCYSTLRAECNAHLTQPGLSVEDSVVLNYFREIVKRFQRHPTYDWLAQAGITPSDKKTYNLAEMQAALKSGSGATPYIGCTSTGAFDEVWYFNYVYGPLINGYYVPTESTSKSSCPATGIKYLPKV
ncbi:ribonuclease T2 [Tilletiaria anomala UBC 951]|uniref:ribonuclease T2 n=1 Tax=Tilletiaria anomala (strain ATCC 24038 / CBS 436.72 / UBC 951) TaxID=1037660 RepID=A0A066W194_TILAU|nr:ribonuclease T2 [Tilletiaria anomala UBC 951]KDN46308.1 ribonuclease T2 [Tilletiaria anomala UBC 951]